MTPALGVHRVRKASKALVATKERQEIVEKLGTLERLAHKATLVQLDPRDPLYVATHGKGGNLILVAP